MALDFTTLALIQFGWIVFGLFWTLKRNDEVPLLSSALLFYIAGFRYWSVTHGNINWVDISQLGFGLINDARALESLNYIVLGQSVLLGVYVFCQRSTIHFPTDHLSLGLIEWLRPKVFVFGFISAPLVLLSRGHIGAASDSGASLGFEVSSYIYLFPYVMIAIGLLTFALWRFGGLNSPTHRALGVALIGLLFYLTYGPSSRFQFLGWVAGGTVIVTSGLAPGKRIALLAAGACLAIGLFAAAGALRTAGDEEGKESAWERILKAEDANMLDGFALLDQVYPGHLAFRHGMEHVDILLRPIPRKLWPGKPVGGYINRLGLVTADSGFTLGISPTLFGSFFEEGGGLRILILSAVYGFAFARLTQFSLRVHPFAGVLIRAMFCAGLIPLLWGGDLPGIYAWFGMAFWPCLLLLYVKRRELLWPSEIEEAPVDAVSQLGVGS